MGEQHSNLELLRETRRLIVRKKKTPELTLENINNQPIMLTNRKFRIKSIH